MAPFLNQQRQWRLSMIVSLPKGLLLGMGLMMMLCSPSTNAFAPSFVSFSSPLTTTTIPKQQQQPQASSTRKQTTQLSYYDRPRSDDPMNNRHSASDWWYNVKSLPRSKVLREVRNPVLSVALWSAAVSMVYRVGLGCHTNSFLFKLARHMSIPGTAHGFLVSALGLLLVFRTNSAYQRFNEGRTIWENILSVSRNMSRLIQLYQTNIGPELVTRMTQLIAAYPYLLRQHIRPGCLCTNKSTIPQPNRLLLTEQHYTAETRHEEQFDLILPKTGECWVDKRALPWSLFLETSLPDLARAANRPLWVCDRLASLVTHIPYSSDTFTSRERLALLGYVDKLTTCIGQCERIHQTAVPLNYARHSLRSLTVWLFTLPFCLVQSFGLFTAPAAMLIAWILFGVYQIGYSIEDPFQGSLRLSTLCESIRQNVLFPSWRQSAFEEVNPNNNKTSRQTPPLPLSSNIEELLRAPSPTLFPAENGTFREVGI